MTKGDIVKNDNFKKGHKVIKGPDWEYGDQDIHSIYGVIVTPPGTYNEDCEVIWIDQHNHPLKKYVYRTGRAGKHDLVFYQDTIDYSLEDMFADLDALADKFK